MKTKDFILRVAEELLHYKDVLKKYGATYTLTLNFKRVIDADYLKHDIEYIIFDDSSIQTIKNELDKINNVRSTNFTVTLQDKSVWKKNKPNKWFTSNIIFYSDEYSGDEEEGFFGVFDFGSTNISLRSDNTSYGTKTFENEEDIKIYIEDIIDLFGYYVEINDNVSTKIGNIFLNKIIV